MLLTELFGVREPGQHIAHSGIRKLQEHVLAPGIIVMSKNQFIRFFFLLVAAFINFNPEIDIVYLGAGTNHAICLGIVQNQAGIPVDKAYPVIAFGYGHPGTLIKIVHDTFHFTLHGDSRRIKSHIRFYRGTLALYGLTLYRLSLGLARRLDIILGRIGSFGRYLGIISIHRHVGLRCLS